MYCRKHSNDRCPVSMPIQVYGICCMPVLPYSVVFVARFSSTGIRRPQKVGTGKIKDSTLFFVYSLKQGFVRHKQNRDGNAHRTHHKRRNRAARTHKSMVCKSHQPLKFHVLQHFQQCHHRHRPASNHQPRPWSRLFQTLLRHPHRRKSEIANI